MINTEDDLATNTPDSAPPSVPAAPSSAGGTSAAVTPPAAGAPGRQPVALLVVALLVALVVQPRWPVDLVMSLLWLGGAWRWLAVPLSVAAAGSVLVANTLAPNAAWAWLCRTRRRVRSWTPSIAALVVGLGAVAYSTGLLAGSTVVRAIFLLALQFALFPGTPLMVMALTLVAALLDADRRRQRLLCWLWTRRPVVPGVEGAVKAAAPAVVVAATAALLAAALFPSAMQGWARAEGPDAQRYNFYSSYFNYAISDDRMVEREGYELGKLGLTLPPGRTGVIVFRLERPPEAVVLLKANFYNRRFGNLEGSLVEQSSTQTFPNALEVSTDEGRSYRSVLANTSVGEVVGNAVADLSGWLGTSRGYWLRFRATNTTSAEVTVLPSLVVTTVVDPLALPHPTFPVVAYFAAFTVPVYLIARLARRAGGSAAGHAAREAGVTALAVAAGATVLAAGAQVWGPALLGARSGPAAFVSGAPAGGPLDPQPGADYALLVARGALAVSALVLLILARPWRTPQGAASDRAASDRAASDRAASDRAASDGASPIPCLALACLLVALVALDARWDQLMRVRSEFLLPDAQGYQAIAEAFPQKLARYEGQRRSALLEELYAAGYDGRASVPAVFYAGGNNGREPLWPAALRLVFNALGVSAFHTRLASLGFGVLVAVLTCWVGWRVLHPLAGMTAGLLLALNRPHIVNSVSGLREEIVSSLFLLLVAALFVGARRAARPGAAVSWWRIAAAGAAAGGVVLVRADMVLLAGLVVTLAALVLRWRWQHWLATVAVMGLLAGPMYVGYAFTHGDAFYPGTYGATVNRNLEFPERMGTPGFPSPAEYAANWAAGPRISPLQYFFGYHTLGQFISYSVRGFTRIFPTILFEQQPLLLWLFGVGMALLLLQRRWFVPFMVVLSLAPFYAFLAGVPNPWVFPGRYAHHALPYAEMAAAYAVWAVPLWLATHLQRRRLPSPGAVRAMQAT